VDKSSFCQRLHILYVLTHRSAIYFLPNFLSTGFGERFCALWRMLHLASAAAHKQRVGVQDSVTPRMQRGAELRISAAELACGVTVLCSTATSGWTHAS